MKRTCKELKGNWKGFRKPAHQYSNQPVAQARPSTKPVHQHFAVHLTPIPGPHVCTDPLVAHLTRSRPVLRSTSSTNIDICPHHPTSTSAKIYSTYTKQLLAAAGLNENPSQELLVFAIPPAPRKPGPVTQVCNARNSELTLVHRRAGEDVSCSNEATISHHQRVRQHDFCSYGNSSAKTSTTHTHEGWYHGSILQQFGCLIDPQHLQ